MNTCDFVKTLTPEQKDQLREMLKEDRSKYQVKVGFWDDERTRIRCLKEYQGDQLHGKEITWFKNGQKGYEIDYGPQGQRHGKSIGWFKNGQKHWEKEYHQGQPHGKHIRWDENGQVMWESKWEYGKEIK